LRGLERIARPSNSIPIEKSLQSLRPRQLERPACQARSSQDTNCNNFPWRRIRKCADTLKPRMPW
jgi:hypothetical protein